jgi:molecular chaperone DnaJ
MPQSLQRDYYEVLGIPRDADPKAIKEAFRKLALQYHPDRNKEPGAEERFKEIAEAYAVLSDPNKRAEYDARGHAGVADFSAEDLFAGINFDDLFGGLGFDFGRGGGLFDHFFRRRRASPARGANLEIDLEIPLERVVSGGDESVRFPRSVTCPVCHGSGAKPGTAPHPCQACGGSGQKVTRRRSDGVVFQQVIPCPECQGQGTLIDKPCSECQGLGKLERIETLTVKIPVGVEEGIALRVPGHGMPSPVPGGVPGDLFVVVSTRPDSRFERRGADLWRVETLEIPDAVLGTSLEVPTLEGPATVKIPPGAQPDEVLRLRGKGLPEFGGGTRGDLYIGLRLHVPERLSAEERELYQRLQALSRGGGNAA